MDYAKVLEGISRSMGAAPRRLGVFRGHWRMKRPAWVSADSNMRSIFGHQDLLLTRGRLTWGVIVQANKMLFTTRGRDGRTNAPADALYTEDPAGLGSPLPMLAVAENLFSFKEGERPDADAERLGAMIADEFLRKHRVPVPPQWSPAYPTFMTSIFVDRAHLPGRTLHGALLPMLILPERTDVVMIAPRFFWPAAFVAGEWS
jgi:hypothetical protein